MLYVGLAIAFVYYSIFEYPCPNCEILSPTFIHGSFGSKSFFVSDSRDLSSISYPLELLLFILVFVEPCAPPSRSLILLSFIFKSRFTSFKLFSNLSVSMSISALSALVCTLFTAMPVVILC